MCELVFVCYFTQALVHVYSLIYNAASVFCLPVKRSLLKHLGTC